MTSGCGTALWPPPAQHHPVATRHPSKGGELRRGIVSAGSLTQAAQPRGISLPREGKERKGKYSGAGALLLRVVVISTSIARRNLDFSHTFEMTSGCGTALWPLPAWHHPVATRHPSKGGELRRVIVSAGSLTQAAHPMGKSLPREGKERKGKENILEQVSYCFELLSFRRASRGEIWISHIRSR